MILLFLGAMLLVACALGRTSTPILTITPRPTVTPSNFKLYGQSLTEVSYCTGGVPLQKMDLYFPEAGGPWPVVMYIHGGSWMRGDKAEAGLLAYWMTSQGYLVVSINYRLYPEVRFPAMIEDAKCAIRSLRANAAELNLDPNRIAVIGASAGGHLAALLGTTDETAGWDLGEHPDQSSRVQAVVAMAPVTDLSRNFPNADLETMRMAGFDETTIGVASPINHITPDDPPFLFIHGVLDTVVPSEQSTLMHDRLTDVGVPAQLVLVENAGHSFSMSDTASQPSFQEINQIIMDFLARYLQ
jgi:acetyl esterase/lipase